MDGPAGTGKSTVSRAVAQALGLPHLDTGAFYRAAGLLTLEASADLDDEAQVVEAVGGHTFDQVEGRMQVDGRDVSTLIRSRAVSDASSRVSVHPELRRLMVAEQRRWVHRQGRGAVVEGRDIGSVVFPEARLKVYLDATTEVRARRRAEETGEDYGDVLTQVRERDRRDSTRPASPLIVPDGAVVVDTSGLTIPEVVARVVDLAGKVGGDPDLP